jgi:hypothetical protein
MALAMNGSIVSPMTTNSLIEESVALALESEFGVSFSEEQSVEIMNYPLNKMVLQEHGVKFQ